MSSENFPDPEQIKKLRIDAELDQTELGKIACISFRAVSLIETGRQNPSKGTLILWALWFNEDFGLDWVREEITKKSSKITLKDSWFEFGDHIKEWLPRIVRLWEPEIRAILDGGTGDGGKDTSQTGGSAPSKFKRGKSGAPILPKPAMTKDGVPKTRKRRVKANVPDSDENT